MASETTDTTMTVNGRPTTLKSPPDRLLLEVLREDLALTGTKYGCGEGSCGACTVLLDGRPTFSCSTRMGDVAGKSITTIEGLSLGDELHPVQAAFLKDAAFQCGYCTPGMIMAAAALLEKTPSPDEAQIVEAMNGHICRCCTYPRIITAVRDAAENGRKS
jgi:aerobic-type carbon monoxide dehydrogenase small subunit (CoxS/CutS family)